jgi:AcrR family transcriptional regulator
MPRVAAKDRPAFQEERRATILAAALRVWARRGFDGTSLEAVAQEAGLSKGTLYLYFPGKQALLEATLRRYSLRPDVEAGLASLRGQPLGAVVRGLVTVLWRGLRERRELVSLLLRELPGHAREARRFVEQVVVPVNRLLADYLAEALPPERLASLDPVVAARSLLGMVIAFFVSQELLGAGALLPGAEERVIGTISELFLHGSGDGRGAAA